jgi:hypothetical protein
MPIEALESRARGQPQTCAGQRDFVNVENAAAHLHGMLDALMRVASH